MGLKLEIELSDDALKRIKTLQKIDKDLRETFERNKQDGSQKQLENLAKSIDDGVKEIQNLLLIAIYENKEWQ